MLLEYDDLGRGPVVVFLHGFPLNRTMWKGQYESELAGRFRLILPDLRGHGASAAPEGPYTIDEMADDVIETLDSLALSEPLVVAGLSMGGYVALSLVLRYPSRVRGLMLLNSRTAGDAPKVAESREHSAQEIRATGSVEGLVGAMLPKLFAPETYANQPGLVSAIEREMLTAQPMGVVNTLHALAHRPDRSAQLDHILTPTLILAGDQDQIIPLEESNRIAASLPNAKLCVIAGAGHLAPLENPSQTNEAMLDFLRLID